MVVTRQRIACKIPTKPYTVVSQNPEINRPVYIGTTKSERAALDLFERQVELAAADNTRSGETWTVRLYRHTPKTRVNSITSAGTPAGLDLGKPYLLAVEFPGSLIIRESTPRTRLASRVESNASSLEQSSDED